MNMGSWVSDVSAVSQAWWLLWLDLLFLTLLSCFLSLVYLVFSELNLCLYWMLWRVWWCPFSKLGISGVDGTLSHAGDRRARWKWSSLEKRLRRCCYPCKPKVGWVTPYVISGCNTCMTCIYFCRKYTGKIMFQSDLINNGKQLTGPVLLFWMEKGGERDCLLHLVKIHMQPCITDPLLWLVSQLCRLAATFLSSVVKLQLLIISFSYRH